MKKTFQFRKLKVAAIRSSSMALFCGATLMAMSQPLSLEKGKTVVSAPFAVNFSDFSPAFAAFEDEFLFEDQSLALPIQAGESDQAYLSQLEDLKSPPPPSLETIEVAPPMGFDGSTSVSANRNFHSISKKRQSALIAHSKTRKITGDEFKFGSLASQVAGRSAATPIALPASNPQTKSPQQKKSAAYAPEKKGLLKPVAEDSFDETILVQGSFQLKEGLAFLGSVEVSWVVGDYEWARGSINTQDATYSIPVDQKVGDIIFSLFDNKDQLIGEGIVDITQLDASKGRILADIDVYPINWDLAGQVIDGYSLGMGQYAIDVQSKMVTGAEIELYAFNESTKTNAKGEFSFFGWKKSNSRSIAIASKKGYLDSIFSLDSKTEAQVILFKERFIDAFFTTLEMMGRYEDKDHGIVYGTLAGPSLTGYSVSMPGYNPVYFESGLPKLDKKITSADGLFAFVGLDDGDHELNLIRDGQVVDQKIVIVEQGKISPIVFELKTIKKHLHLYDPMNPDHRVTELSTDFFDGQKTRSLNLENQTTMTVPVSGAPLLLDYRAENQWMRGFVSGNNELQRLPLLRDKSLMELAEKNQLKIEDGLVFGFVDPLSNNELYKAYLLESPQAKTIYFNAQGDSINPEEEVAFGFVMGGVKPGLGSVVLQRLSDGTLLSSDLIYNDLQAISILEMVVSPY